MVDFPAIEGENDHTNAEASTTRCLKSTRSANPLKLPPPPGALAAATSALTVAKTNYCCCGNDSSTRDNNASDVIEISAVESVSLGGFFGTVWDCSLALGAFIASLGPGAMRGRKVVELGAGCGAVSALCAALGASEVVATDARDLIPLLTLNLRRNCYAGAVNVKVGVGSGYDGACVVASVAAAAAVFCCLLALLSATVSGANDARHAMLHQLSIETGYNLHRI